MVARDKALLVHLRQALFGNVAEAVDYVCPDKAVTYLIAKMGGIHRAKDWFANAEVAGAPKDSLGILQQSKHLATQDAVAATAAANALSDRTVKRGENATADDHADAIEAHLRAAAAHTSASSMNPDAKPSHDAMNLFHTDQAAGHVGDEKSIVDALPERKEQLDKLHALIGQGAVAGSASVADQMDAFAPSATALTRREKNTLGTHSANLRGVASLTANEGNADGAAKGHATKRENASSDAYGASTAAQLATNKAHATNAPVDQKAARDANQKASDLHAKAKTMFANADDPARAEVHQGLETMHKATADYHGAKCAETNATYKGNEVVIAANEGGDRVVEFVNEFNIEGKPGDDSNWAQLAPYGNWPHGEGLQKFDKTAANEIVKNFNSVKGKASTLFLGTPFYIGHPDHPAFKQRYTDTRAYGRIKELQARDDGLWGNVKWSKQGKEMVNEGMFHGHSVNWAVVANKDGSFKPVCLKSVGFTNEPNIPVAPITHANELSNMKLSELAKTLGLKETANEAEVMEAARSLANGDFPGHPFHGNQFADAGEGDAARGKEANALKVAQEGASRAASQATGAASQSGSKSDHEAAATAHRAAAAAANKTGNKQLTLYHDTMARMHDDAASHSRANELVNKINRQVKTGKVTNDQILEWCNDAGAVGGDSGTVPPTVLPTPDHCAAEKKLITDLQTQLTGKANELTTANEKVTRLTGERAKVSAAIIKTTLANGRILKNEQATVEAELANDATFVSTAERVLNAKPKLHTTSVVDGRRGASAHELANTQERQDKVKELVNEEMKTEKDYTKAFANVKKKHKQLFDLMVVPNNGE